DNPEFRARTLAEGRALARIDHPNVVRLNAVVVEPKALYLVMQFIDGEPLDKLIERHVSERRPLAVLAALAIFRMILQGVGAAHAEGLIHRDLKPANILVRRRDGVAKVTDFGIAKVEEEAKAGRGVTKGIIGSLAYMAPEQVRGQRDLDKRVDIYALGIVLFEMLMGRVPFEAPSDYELMRMHTDAPIPKVSALRPDVPLSLERVIERACAKDRELRFATCDDFFQAIEAQSSPKTEPLAIAPVGIGSAPPWSSTPEATVRTQMASLPLPSIDAAGPLPFSPPEPAPFARQSVPAPYLPPEPAPFARRSVPAPIAPPAAFNPGPSDHPMRATTEGGASLPPYPASLPPRRKSAALVWVAAAGVAVIGGGALYVGLSDESTLAARGPHAAPDAGEKAVDTGHAVDAGRVVEAAPLAKASPLASLAGKWKSSSQREFTAVLTGKDALEFRIDQALQHPRQGYENGEVRFKLTALPASTSEFAVEDFIRPIPPPGIEYDAESRSSCVAKWTGIKGQKLLAQFDGASTLTVDLVQIQTAAGKFKRQGARVTGCTDLESSPATAIESKLTRAD
ncbi:MAG TPA: protein kinase, partial [Polyangiaceae bacterium]|nr:protein kinase [Polyangiaceae bacterium]